MTIRTCLGAVSLLLLLCAQSFGIVRELTNKEGVTILAELIQVDKKDGKRCIEIRMRDRRTFHVPLADLSKEDRDFIEQWWSNEKIIRSTLTAEVDLTIDVSNKDVDKKTSEYNDYTDLEIYTYQASVLLENEERDQDYEDNEVLLLVFGKYRNHYKNRLMVLSATKKENLDLPSRAEVSVQAKPYKVQVYDYDGTSYDYGYEYEGYAVVIKNRNGDITHTKASRSLYLKDIDLLYKMREDEVYFDDIENKLVPYSSIY